MTVSRKFFWVELILRLGVAAVFIAAAVPKLIDPRAFALDIANYKILHASLSNLAALTIAPLELIAAVIFIAGPWKKIGGILIAAMLSMFIAAIVLGMLRGLDISCGCFGHDSGKLGVRKLLEDIVLLAVTLYLTFSVYFSNKSQTNT